MTKSGRTFSGCCRLTRRLRSAVRAASTVEMAIALPLLFLLLAVVIDFGFYFAILGMLNYFVHDALDLASRLDVTVDSSPAACPIAATPVQCTSYRARKARILSTVETPMLSLWVKPYGQNGIATFDQYRNTSDFGSPWLSGVYFMRPGESWTRMSNNTVVDHPTRAAAVGGPSGSETWETVFRDHPLVVGAEVLYRPIFSRILFGTMRIRAEAIGFHRSRFFGQPYPRDLGQPSGTPSGPTSTPGPTPPITPTSTPPPITPTPTAAPTPCAFCWNAGAGFCCTPFVPVCCHGYGG